MDLRKFRKLLLNHRFDIDSMAIEKYILSFLTRLIRSMIYRFYRYTMF